MIVIFSEKIAKFAARKQQFLMKSYRKCLTRAKLAKYNQNRDQRDDCLGEISKHW